MHENIVDLNITLWTIVFTLLNTTILFWAMKMLLFKPVHDFMTNRNNKILSDIENAETKKREADAILFDYNNKLAGIYDERNKIITDGRKRGEELFEKFKRAGELERHRLLSNAENERNLMMKKAREELKNEVALLSLSIAEDIIKKTMDLDTHNQLIDEALKDISNIKLEEM